MSGSAGGPRRGFSRIRCWRSEAFGRRRPCRNNLHAHNREHVGTNDIQNKVPSHRLSSEGDRCIDQAHIHGNQSLHRMLEIDKVQALVSSQGGEAETDEEGGNRNRRQRPNNLNHHQREKQRLSLPYWAGGENVMPPGKTGPGFQSLGARNKERNRRKLCILL